MPNIYTTSTDIRPIRKYFLRIGHYKKISTCFQQENTKSTQRYIKTEE